MTKRLENGLRFDEMYDLSITDARKGLYTLGYHAKKFGRAVRKRGIAAALLGAMTVGACKLPIPDPDPIPNPPAQTSIDFTQVNSNLKNMNEEQIYSVPLPTTDKNGNPVLYTSIASPDGKTSPVLDNQYNLTVAGNTDANGNFKINVEYNDNGESGVATLEGYLYNTLDVKGHVINNKTESPHGGKVKIANSADVNFTNPLGEVEADPSTGYFEFHSPTTRTSNLAGVSIKAVLTDIPNGPSTSYANTMRYSAGDVNGAIIRPHPHITFDTNGDTVVNQTDWDNYREHRRRTNTGTEIRPEDGKERGLLKWDLNGEKDLENILKGIIVFQTNTNGSSFSYGNQYEIIKRKIRDHNDIEVAIRGSNFNSGELDNLIHDSSFSAGYTNNNGSIQPNPGYILVLPDNTLAGNLLGTNTEHYYQNYLSGIINGAVIRINPNIGDGNLFETVVSHEFKHAFNAPFDLITTDSPGDPGYPHYDLQTLHNPWTILRYDTNNVSLGDGKADTEDAHITNTYSPRMKLDDIFGTW